MKIGLIDCDNTKFPNLALMKLSAYHRSIGNSVDWYSSEVSCDITFASKAFTFTEHDLPVGCIEGGSGFDLNNTLPSHIEHICPDYELYGLDYSLGFLTRGCHRKCEWCFVPEKEGEIAAHADIDEFLRHDKVVLMDNNVLAHEHGIKQIEKLSTMNVKVDFNQGLDARLIDNSIARLLSKIKWLKPLRLACDSSAQIPYVEKAVQRLRYHNTTPSRYFCYVLVQDIDDALERIRFLKGMYVDPFAQPYIGPNGEQPSKKQKQFARWVNHKAEFKSRTWEDYLRARIERGG